MPQTVGRDGSTESVTTAVRDEGAVVKTVRAEGRPIRAGETVTIPGSTVVGACIPVDYTRHRFALTVTVQFRDTEGTVTTAITGPKTTGPAA